MEKLKIKKNDLIDLIFFKKIMCNGMCLEIDSNTLDILNEIEDKMIFGRFYRSKKEALS